MIKVVFMGTPDFAIEPLKALIEKDDCTVEAVFTQPDKPKGRSGKLQMSPVKEKAISAGIPVFQPEKIRDPKWMKDLLDLHPDVIVAVAFGQMIPQTILDLPRYGCINVHASLLPKYRGAAPIQWAVINGEKESGVTTMRMDAGLDTGDIIMQDVVELNPDETGKSLSDKLSKAGARLLMQTLDAVINGTAKYIRQPEESPTDYARMLTKADGKIDWNSSAKELECRIRGLNPWPCAWTRKQGKLLKIWNAKAVEENFASPQPAMTPGSICRVEKDAFYVQTGSGLLCILELQPEGKKRMPAQAYLRGYPVKAGEQIFTE